LKGRYKRGEREINIQEGAGAQEFSTRRGERRKLRSIGIRHPHSEPSHRREKETASKRPLKAITRGRSRLRKCYKTALGDEDLRQP